MNMWPDSRNPHVEPPVVKPMPGRPRKIRKREAWETQKSGKLSRKGVYMTCSTCQGKNHNKSNCPLKDSVATGPSNETGTSRAPPRPRGRPKKTPTTAEAPSTVGAPPEPRERPRETNVNPDAPPRPRGRPRKTTNNDFDVEAPARGRGRTCEQLQHQLYAEVWLLNLLQHQEEAWEELLLTSTCSSARGRGIGRAAATTTSSLVRGKRHWKN